MIGSSDYHVKTAAERQAINFVIQGMKGGGGGGEGEGEGEKGRERGRKGGREWEKRKVERRERKREEEDNNSKNLISVLMILVWVSRKVNSFPYWVTSFFLCKQDLLLMCVRLQ